MSNELRNKHVLLKLTETEHFLLTEKAERADMSRSELLRNLIYFGTASQRTNFTTEDAFKIVNELSTISNSMEQIAYSAKTNCAVSEQDFDSIIDNFKDFVITFDNFARKEGSE
ncbi:MAG: hypothetical protein FWC20_00635 [Oscillospiraceae bacterium]|nr:hypothetical protein [Oscillospiraceae bacterium]MCL2277899.1 hypothetical protein [Oscillospiraceae bacterium]